MISTVFLFAILATSTSASQFWVTTVVTELKVREQCASFWSQTQVCSSPLLRVSTDINNPTQFASKAWPMSDVLESTESPSFISQWHGTLQSIRVSVQIEGSSQLNPFGLVAKCDQGMHPKVTFNQSSPDVWQRLPSRVVLIEAQCFVAKVLVKVDTECPYCPPPTTTTIATTTTSLFPLSPEHTLLGAVVLLSVLTILFVAIFLCTLRRFLKHRRSQGFKNFASLESGISTISPASLTNVSSASASAVSSTVSSTVASIQKPPYFDMFSVLPPLIDYDDLDVTSVNIEAMPRLGSLVYSLYENELNISYPVYV